MDDLEIARIAEGLAAEFPHLPTTTVIRVLTECVDELSSRDPTLIENAARARLRSEDPTTKGT